MRNILKLKRKIGLCVVDAWELLLEEDLELFPSLEGDCRAFAIWLNRVLALERKRGTIILHDSADKAIMKEIKVGKGDIRVHSNGRMKDKFGNLSVLDVVDQEKIEKLYFCGFHFNECIANAANFSRRHGIEVGIAINLSMLYPSEWWRATINHSNDVHRFKHYFWGNLGFEKINIYTNFTDNDWIVDKNGYGRFGIKVDTDSDVTNSYAYRDLFGTQHISSSADWEEWKKE